MRKVLAVTFLVLVMALVGCGNDEEIVSIEGLEYNQADFDLALPDMDGNLVTVIPNGKTIYAYFTGVGWQVCINQLVELNNNSDKFPGVKFYAISLSTPEEHSLVKETFKLDHFEFLTDYQGDFGERFGFIDTVESKIYRGYLGVNPATENIVIELDYLIGQNLKTVIKVMEEL
jgi:peroxiredoxin